ncbi:MAG TPA: hypothetical protein VF549_21745 [Solirubrobacteraceae bacterium]|jgi:hypothetical protein
MGFLDDVRRAKQAAEAQPEGLSRKERVARAMEELERDDLAEFEARWRPPGSELPYVEVLKTAGKNVPHGRDIGWRPTVVEAYLVIVGVRPEDCFGMWPSHLTDGGVGKMAIVYRDRPEYAAGRERFEEWRRGQ